MQLKHSLAETELSAWQKFYYTKTLDLDLREIYYLEQATGHKNLPNGRSTRSARQEMRVRLHPLCEYDCEKKSYLPRGWSYPKY